MKSNGDLNSPKIQQQQQASSCVDTSIDQLYDNVCDMEESSEDGSLTRNTYGSDGDDDDESRIDSELRHLVGGEITTNLDISPEEDHFVEKDNEDREEEVGSVKTRKKRNSVRKKKTKKDVGVGNDTEVTSGSEMLVENPNLGPFLLKHAIDLIQSDNPRRALDYAIRASKSLEKCSDGKPSLDLVMSLHALAAIHCSLGQHALAIPILKRAISIPVVNDNNNDGHALAKFAGCMQLGDTYGMLGMLENAIICYSDGLQLQKQALGESDRRVGETCRYLAEVHVQALQFDEAEKLCKLALDIHMENTDPAAISAQNDDRKLMGLICETKGDHDAALEHLVLASMGMTADGREIDMASIDCSIGDAYLSLGRYEEAIFAYHKALNKLKSSKGDAHPAVASVFVRLGYLHNKIGKIRESISYCESALKIYGKPPPGTPLEEIATGFIDVSAVYELMDDYEYALRLLQKALKIYDGASSGQHSTVAGIEAQIGVLYYILGKYKESYSSLTNATSKLRVVSVEDNNRTKKKKTKKSAFFGIALNQLGLVCVQLYSIKEAADLFEEAKDILEEEHGLYHPDTLGVYSNLAGTYDALGRYALMV